MAHEPGFLIGAPLTILLNRLVLHVMAGLASSGFGDLSPAYLPMFQLIGPQGSRVTDIARQAGMTKQAVGYLVAYLERHGYVRREPDPSDRRANLVVRTERGWKVNQVSSDVVLRVQAEWAQLIGEQEMTALVGALRSLVAQLGAEYRGSVADIEVLASRRDISRRS